MCGRFASWSNKNRILEHFGLGTAPEYYAGYNIYPTTNILARTANGLENLYWGFLPGWAKDRTFECSLATAEKILDKKPFFRDAFRNRRCLVPVNGYYEWDEKTRPRQPWFIRLKETEIFSLAGVWDTWESDAGPRNGLAIITIPPKDPIAHIHHRSPVIIRPEDYDQWLLEGGEKFISPYDGDYEFWPVSTRVNNPAHQGPDLLERAPVPTTLFQ